MLKNLELEPLTMYQIAWRDESGDWCFSPTMYSKESAKGIARAFRADGSSEAVVLEIVQTRTVIEEEQS